MRILGFSKKWYKLQRDEFTTFRFPRKDKDWQEGEVVQVVYKPRSKEREVLGLAKIVSIEQRLFGRSLRVVDHYLVITNIEAHQDGFPCYGDMALWFREQYGNRIFSEPINRLALEWEAYK